MSAAPQPISPASTRTIARTSAAKPRGAASVSPVMRRIALLSIALLMAKVLGLILWEYRNYLPPNFESAFLVGRQSVFVGLYPASFYAHLIVGPVTLLTATWLMITGSTGRYRRLHRSLGKFQVLAIVVVLLPTGLVLAWDAHAGPIAALGFGLLSVLTALFAVAAAVTAKAGKILAHRRWAMRCFLMLISPLLLRIGAGAMVFLDRETPFYYQINAWFSWLVPLIIYQVYLVACSGASGSTMRQDFPTHSPQQVVS